MNPRGRPCALARTLPGWASLDDLTGRQRRAWMAYRGTNPWVYGRYGRRQWGVHAQHPQGRVRDALAPGHRRGHRGRDCSSTGIPARSGQLSRMGWEPDLDELAPVMRAHNTAHPADPPVTSNRGPAR